MSRDLYLYSKKEKATIKKILDSLQQADDMTMALDLLDLQYYLFVLKVQLQMMVML